MKRYPLTPVRSADTVGGAGAKRPDLLARLAEAHAKRARDGLLRRLRSVDQADGARIVVAGRSLLNFASNDYLGLSQHPALRDALTRAAARWGVGATASHLLGGHREEHVLLEEKIARWTGRERALLFSTGYTANLGAISALLQEGDVCVQDKLNHTSLLDAARLSSARIKRYRHADSDSARQQFETLPAAAALLATDGVFSMDGDIAPLRELATLCKKQCATLLVDDAHGIGVLGADGAGSLAAAGLGQDEAPVLMATLGKALGVAGAFVAGSAALIDGLVQFSRTHTYTTAMPPALAAAASAAIDLAQTEIWRRDKLHSLIAQLRDGARARGMSLLDSRTPIQPLLVGSSGGALHISRQMENAGFYIPAIRPPTVPAGKARLRITLSATHEPADIERLLDALASASRRRPMQ